MLLALICKFKEQNRKDSGTTLVVMPLSLLSQWEEELLTKTNLSYSVYYGDQKSDELDGVDVVLTTCK